MSYGRKRVVVFYEQHETQNEIKSVIGRNAEVIAANDRASIEAAMRLYGKVDVIVTEASHAKSPAIELLKIARTLHPASKRLLIVDGDGMQSAYQAVLDGTVQSYLMKPMPVEQFREMLGIPIKSPARDELDAIAKRMKTQPPLTGGNRASSSPSLS